MFDNYDNKMIGKSPIVKGQDLGRIKVSGELLTRYRNRTVSRLQKIAINNETEIKLDNINKILD